MSKRLLVTIITFVIIVIAATAAIFFSKGYTFSPKEGRVVGTGLISITSTPDGASVYIDGHLTTATNTTISQLKPRTYNIKIVKEGLIPWEKNIEVSEGLVSEIKATLFPALPTIYPLTFNGAINPVLSPDGQKLAFTVPFSPDSHTRQRGGVWVWSLSSQPISFNRGAEPHQIAVSNQSLDFAKSTLRWSPDSKQVLATMQEGNTPGEASARNFLLGADQRTSDADLKDITPILENTLKTWAEDQKIKDEARLDTILDVKVKNLASASASPSASVKNQAEKWVHWSPDETKFMVGEKGSVKVYDLATNKEYFLPGAKNYSWLPDSKHIIFVMEDKIGVGDFDGSNVAVVYAGKFEGTYVFPWPDSSRLMIISSYPTPTGNVPNLFGVNLK